MEGEGVRKCDHKWMPHLHTNANGWIILSGMFLQIKLRSSAFDCRLTAGEAHGQRSKFYRTSKLGWKFFMKNSNQHSLRIPVASTCWLQVSLSHISDNKSSQLHTLERFGCPQRKSQVKTCFATLFPSRRSFHSTPLHAARKKSSRATWMFVRLILKLTCAVLSCTVSLARDRRWNSNVAEIWDTKSMTNSLSGVQESKKIFAITSCCVRDKNEQWLLGDFHGDGSLTRNVDVVQVLNKYRACCEIVDLATR